MDEKTDLSPALRRAMGWQSMWVLSSFCYSIFHCLFLWEFGVSECMTELPEADTDRQGKDGEDDDTLVEPLVIVLSQAGPVEL